MESGLTLITWNFRRSFKHTKEKKKSNLGQVVMRKFTLAPRNAS